MLKNMDDETMNNICKIILVDICLVNGDYLQWGLVSKCHCVPIFIVYNRNMTYSCRVYYDTIRMVKGSYKNRWDFIHFTTENSIRRKEIKMWNVLENSKYSWLDEYLLGKVSVTKDLQRDWNWIRYQIGGKMFAAVCLGEDNKPYYITLKLELEEGDFLRQQYEDIIPGYYMNKTHWNSIKADGNVPDELLKDLLDKSYQLVLGGFSKKKQRELLGEE